MCGWVGGMWCRCRAGSGMCDRGWGMRRYGSGVLLCGHPLLSLVLLRLFNAVSLHRFLTDCVHNAERLWDALRDLIMLAAGLFL